MLKTGTQVMKWLSNPIFFAANANSADAARSRFVGSANCLASIVMAVLPKKFSSLHGPLSACRKASISTHLLRSHLPAARRCICSPIAQRSVRAIGCLSSAARAGLALLPFKSQLGARVISTGSTEAKRALAQHLGAEYVLDPANSHWPAEVRKITNRRGVDLVVEHVGGEVLVKCFDCLARGGTIVTCGATAGREIPFNLWPFFVKQHRLIGSYGRNRTDLKATLEWAATGKLKAVIDSVFPLDQVPAAFEKLRSRNMLGKILIEPFEPASESD